VLLLQYLVVVVMMSPSGTVYMGWWQKCLEEMGNSTRLWIWRDPSLSLVIVDSHFVDLGHHSTTAAVVAHSWRICRPFCQTIDVDRCRHTGKLQSVLTIHLLIMC